MCAATAKPANTASLTGIDRPLMALWMSSMLYSKGNRMCPAARSLECLPRSA